MTDAIADVKMLWTTAPQIATVVRLMAEERTAESLRVGNEIKRLRRRKGLSQEELAPLVGVSVATVSRWERGMHGGYAGNVKKLARVLGVKPERLTPVAPTATSQLDRLEARLDTLEQRLLDALSDVGSRVDEAVEAAALLTEQDREALRALDALQARLGRDQVGRDETRSRTARASRKAAQQPAA